MWCSLRTARIRAARVFNYSTSADLTHGRQSLPHRHPRYLDFYRQGRLLLDEMVTRRGRLDDINEAFRAMKAGEVARSVLMFD